MFPSVKYMGYERMYVQLACGNECTELFHAETSAWHETAVDLFEIGRASCRERV